MLKFLKKIAEKEQKNTEDVKIFIQKRMNAWMVVFFCTYHILRIVCILLLMKKSFGEKLREYQKYFALSKRKFRFIYLQTQKVENETEICDE